MDFLIAEFDLSPYLSLIWTITKVALGLGFVIFVHELGHFAVAKMCGVKCEKFYVGFDVPIRIGPIRLPRRLFRVQWGETEYGIGIIPLGGYVKMLGQDDDPRNAQREAERIRVKNEGEEAAVADDSTATTGERQAAERTQALQEGTAAEGFTPGQSVEQEYQLDPRSFPAKSVPARMAIISAGVIMNLIFAVIMAAIAFRIGVPFTPTIIGSTTPGDPAWEAGLDRMDRIVQLGERGSPSRKLRWDWDMQQAIGEAGLSKTVQPVSLLVDKHGQPQLERYILTPSERMKPLAKIATLGIRSLSSTTVASRPGMAHVVPAELQEKLQDGDRVVAVNGIPLDREHANWLGDLPAPQLDDLLFEFRDQSVTLTFERPQGEDGSPGEVSQFDIVLPPRAERTLGLTMTMGPIVGVQKNSPAAAAGFQVGDRIQTIDGQPIGDPLRLPILLSDSADSPMTFEVIRKDGDRTRTVELTVTPRDVWNYGPSVGWGERLAINPVGIAYSVEPIVAEVEPGSPAAEAGLMPGDQITEVEFVAADEEKQQLSTRTISPYFYPEEKTFLFGLIRQAPEPISLVDSVITWVDIHGQVQYMLPDTKLKLTFTRDGQTQTAEVGAVESADRFNPDRGLAFKPYTELHEADSLGAAIAAGAGRTKQELGRVAGMVKKLVTGQVSIGHLGGPLAIAYIAGAEASHGIPRLLMFLTFLSANLAILNFLPIPALDGGHFVFLLWEGVTGKPADERVQGALTLIGVACLLGLILFVSLNDVGRFFFSS